MRRLCYLLPALLLAVLVLPPAPGHAGKLADDGRAGVVLEVQGTALVRPAGRQRWTPLGAKSVLYPGDLIRTQARGAHALEIALAKGKALLGPGVELQLTADGTPRLLRGEAEVLGTPEVPLPVAAAGGLALDVKGTAWLRARGKQTEQLAAAPRWVQGYRDSASDEWMGSLLAQVDGRDVPLAVGYHKVDVEVRDQIARTTVEQSFVNGTKNRLEGVFYFPLPADASISGFGMWIGGELVEADIVERQRARQIYEDILRRKKDPGLLEWEGGNIFKARVFPIEPFSEKRIRIRYTQVLPLEGDTWRYRYALRSELLRTKPLRELQIAVRVVSTQAMQEVSSPTHEITLHTTGHEATAEFRASEYRPKDDFELAVKVDRAKAITAIPHRRGEDGYFMLMLAPPAAESSAWQRDLAPEGDPLDVILLADTSGSMDEAARTNQARFLEGMLSLLGSKDRFRLAAFDADVRWLTAEASAPSEDSIRAAMDALAARRSLGWTDLDAGVKAALAQAGEDTLVVYVGDGVSTTGDADAAATAQRMRALGKASKAAIHAVAASSSFEQGVLRALAETGGGSMRALGANPTADAYALLAEAARPSVKDLRVEIEGLRTARVYPSRLPNLPLGSQQVVLGRFLPADTAQDGRVVVHGTLAGKPVRYAADVRIPAADVGNSFLPRLWGRSHINALLEQGGPEINEEIVAFSERFGIMTPLTSFLVLESDEDRKRYGVARRVRMRDGERFFADAKDRAMLEQKRDLMKQAGRWRAGLRGDALRDIARLGRDLPVQFPTQPDSLEVAYAETTTASGFGFTSFGQTAFADKDGDTFFTDRNAAADVGLSIRELQDTTRDARRYAGPMDGGAGDPAGVDSWGDGFDGEASEGGLQGGPVTGATRMRHSLGRGGGGSPAPAATMPPSGPAKKPFAKRGNKSAGRAPERESLESKADMPPGELDDLLEEVNEERARIAQSPTSPAMRRSSFSRAGRLQDGYARAPQPGPPSYAFTLQTLGFPAVPGAPRAAEDVSDPAWDAAALALLRTLPRRADVRKLEGGLHLVLRREGLHPTRGAVTGGRGLEAWIGSESWRMTRTSHSFAERDEQWSHAGVRGALAQARRLARTRTARPTDANAWWLPLWDLRARDVIQAWARAGYRAKVVSADATKAVVDLTRRHPDERTIRLSIDPTRRVITETRWIDATGRTVARLAHADFIEVAGRHWAQRLERYDADDRLVERRRLQVEVIERAALDAVLAKAATERTDALTVHGPLPRRADAKQATRERRATFLDHLVLSLSLGQQQRLPESLAAWDAAAALAAGKPGLPWVRTTFLTRARQGERFKAWLMGLTPKVQAAPGQDGRFLAAWLHGYARSTLGPRERGELLDALRTAWVDAPAPHADLRELAWQRDHIAVLDALGEVRQARALRTALAKAWPHRTSLLLLHERDLWQTGQVAPALAALAQALQDREPWTEGERGALYRRLTDRLWARRELVRLHARLGDWIKTQPRTPEAWQRYLASLYLLGKEEVADARVVADLGITLADEDPRWHTGRLAAAIAMALGDGWNFQVPQLHKPFGKPLVDALLYEMRRTSKRSGPGMRIFGDWRFRRTDHWRGVQQTLFADLQADGALASMPRHKLTRYLQLLPWNAGGAPDALWRSVVDALKARWTAAEDVFDRTALEGHIVRLLDARSEREAAIAFLTQALGRARQGQDGESVRLAGILFYRLLSTPDHDAAQTTEREDACFALLPGLLDPKANAETRLGLAASNLRTLADRLYRWRYARALGTPASRAELTRAELKLLRREARAGTRLAMAQRLGTAEKTATAEYKPWLQLERLAYAVEHGADLEAIVAEASAILGRAWTRPDPEGDRRPLERLMRERAAVVLAYAATRRNASDAVSRGVLETFAAGEAAAPAERGTRLLDWREQTWRLLLARDDAAALEANLRRWIVPAQVESRWRVALGYLLAETGRLPPAAEQLEAVRGLDELAPADYAALADWYLVLDDDARRDRATLARYARMNEGQLSSLAYRYENKMRARRGGVPGDFDPEAVRVLRALMRKATYPANYWYRIRNVYRSTKDFRALDPVAFGLLGHTKESIYAFLNQVSRLAGEVHEEATLDEWNAQLTAQSRAADSPLDRRAMQLAIARVEGRASLVPDTDPAHGARSLAALKAAFEHEWQTGERELMARYLQQMGKVQDPAVRAEQLRQLAALRTGEPEGSLVRLRITDALAQTLWRYDQHDRAIDVLAAELEAVRKTHAGIVPMAARGSFDRHVGWLSHQGRFGDAERVLLREYERWDLPMRRRGIQGRLYVLYVEALRRGGRVSIGRGTALFEATAALIQNAMNEDPAQASGLLNTWCNLHRQGHAVRKPGNAPARLETWAKERFPAFLARVPLNAANYTGTVASTLHDISSPHRGLALLMTRHAGEPVWLRRIGYTVWSRHVYSFARWRREAGSMPDLDPALLEMVTGQLERNLRRGGNHGSAFWNRRNKWSWPERFDVFATTAERVAELDAASATTVVRCAVLLRNSLGRRRPAVDMLAAAERRGILSEGNRWTLARWYREDRSHAEGLALIDGLLEARPENLGYHTFRVDMLAGLGRAQDAKAELEATAKAWTERKRWSESVAATLGASAAKYTFPGLAEGWMEDAIRLRREARGHRGGRDSTLARYYRSLALARAKLGKALEAVQAASSALLMANPRRNSEMRAAQAALRDALTVLPSLPGYIETYDAEVAKSGLDAPVLRKAFAAVMHARKDFAGEITQLRLARELDGGDADVHARLVKAYDAQGDVTGAVDALFGSITLNPYDYTAYQSLADRYVRAGDQASAERARTTLAEVAPHQAAGHRALATIRTKQKRLPEALVQWRQVVRTERLDPTGHLALARALIDTGASEEARAVLQGVLTGTWESRFGDVKLQAGQMLGTLGAKR